MKIEKFNLLIEKNHLTNTQKKKLKSGLNQKNRNYRVEDHIIEKKLFTCY